MVSPPLAFVTPVPVIVPPVQVVAPLTVSDSLPVSVPPESASVLGRQGRPAAADVQRPALIVTEGPSVETTPVRLAVPPLTVMPVVTLYDPASLTVPPVKCAAPAPVMPEEAAIAKVPPRKSSVAPAAMASAVLAEIVPPLLSSSVPPLTVTVPRRCR